MEREGELKPVACRHDPYHGRCVHCGVPFVDGRPLYPAPRPSPVSPEIEGLVERLNREAAKWEGCENPDNPAIVWTAIIEIKFLREAASALSRLSEISTRQSADLDHAEKVRVEAEAERDDALEWAKGWHKAVETAEVLLEIGPCLAADEFPAAVQAAIAQRDLLSVEVERLRKALEPFARRCDEAVRPDDPDTSGLTVKVEYLRAAHEALSPSSHGAGE